MVWSELKYFKKTENWGDPSKMDQPFLHKLDFYREKLGCPITILCGFESEGHSPNSQHKLGKAADLRPTKSNLLDAYIMADRCGFNGIGLYPNQGRWFIHLDNRVLKFPYKNRWIRSDDGLYLTLNAENIMKHIIQK